MLILMCASFPATMLVKRHTTKLDEDLYERSLQKYDKKIRQKLIDTDALQITLLTEDSDISQKSADGLWERTLFTPERKEKTQQIIDLNKKKQNKKRAKFELIGIGKLKETSCAIILVKQFATRRRRGKKQPETKGKKHVYKVGALIEKTGYKLKEVKMTSVTLEDANEELILYLDKSDKESEIRNKKAEEADKQLAKKEDTIPEKKKLKKKLKKEIKDKKNKNLRPPPPPPPPPGVGLPGGLGMPRLNKR